MVRSQIVSVLRLLYKENYIRCERTAQINTFNKFNTYNRDQPQLSEPATHTTEHDLGKGLGLDDIAKIQYI